MYKVKPRYLYRGFFLSQRRPRRSDERCPRRSTQLSLNNDEDVPSG